MCEVPLRIQQQEDLLGKSAVQGGVPSALACVLAIFMTCHNKWVMLRSAAEWAAKKATAESQHRPAEVIAMVGANAVVHGSHTCSPESLIAFLCKVDDTKGSIGLLNL